MHNALQQQGQANAGLPCMLTARKIAEQGVMSERAVRRLMAEGRLAFVPVGKKKLIHPDVLAEVLRGEMKAG